MQLETFFFSFLVFKEKKGEKIDEVKFLFNIFPEKIA